MTEVYWIGKSVVIEWPLTDLAGDPVTDATVTGTITLPDETTAAAAVSHAPGSGVYRASYEPTTAGTHAWRLEATGSVETAEEGTFGVRPHPAVGPAPTLDPGTDIGRVRLLVPDVDEALLLFTDEQIGAFLAMERGTGTPLIKRAAASALESVASSEALISKVIQTQDLKTDGTRVSEALLKRAAGLRDQADSDEDNAAEDDGGFDVVNFRDPFHRRYGAEAAELEC